MSNELKNCPFCDGKDINLDKHQDHNSPTGVVFSMGCYKCGATFPNRYSKEPMIKAWNQRNPNTLNRAVELLEACSEDLFITGTDKELENCIDKFLKEVKQS